MLFLILFILYGIGILINGVVLLVISSFNKMKKCSMNMLLFNLALSDLCVLSTNSVYIMPKLFELPILLKFSTIYCYFHIFMTGVCGLVSILTYLAICVERYIVIVCPLHAANWCSNGRILLLINAIWAFSIMYRLPYFDLAGTEKLSNELENLVKEQVAKLNNFFGTVQLAGIKISFQLVDLTIHKIIQPQLWMLDLYSIEDLRTGRSANVLLEKYARFKSGNKFCMSILLTYRGFTVGGVSYYGGVCHWPKASRYNRKPLSQNVALVNLANNVNDEDLTFNLLHEISQLLGSGHDKDKKDCANELNIMSDKILPPGHEGRLSWSTCSKAAMGNYLKNILKYPKGLSIINLQHQNCFE